MIATSFSPEGRVHAALRSPTRLLVLYDADCALCRRCRRWLEQQPAYVDVEFLGAGEPDAPRELDPLRPWLGNELVVVSERGEAWLGAAAFLVCLWATREYREWSYRLSGPALAPRMPSVCSDSKAASTMRARVSSPARACRAMDGDAIAGVGIRHSRTRRGQGTS